MAEGPGRPGRGDATDGYSTVGKKSYLKQLVTIMTARAGSNPALTTYAPIAQLDRATDF